MGINEKMRWLKGKGPLGSVLEQGEVSFFVGGDVLVKGCGEILSYSEERIDLAVGGRCLTVRGCELSMRSYYRRDIWIGGEIMSVQVGKEGM